MERVLSVELPSEGTLESTAQEEGKRQIKTAVRRAQLLRLAMRGVDATTASRLVGCRPETARKVYADPAFRRLALGKVEGAFAGIDSAYFERKKGLHERLTEKCERAFEELVSILEDPSTSPVLKTKVAFGFLDRNPETQPGYTVASSKFDPEQLREAAQVAKEMEMVGKVVSIKKAG